ncbi:tyrosine-type recombinase/integrase [Halomontanus rarus]|uniref:tyrosine-type recombinase/integrase n=1 Tax=Halomontanus rarus TaxID=3034020 RepID=UPI0023E7A39A|nr:site-specific integrase [Halovivax sp. TS33]
MHSTFRWVAAVRTVETMETGSTGADPGEKTLERCIDDYLNTRQAETSARNMAYALESWREWLARRNVDDFESIDPKCCREYAFHLAERVDAGEFAGSTARTYYAFVRAFLSFAVRDEQLDTNPAMTNRAVEPLPEDEGTGTQQFWTAGKRDALLRYADQQVTSALEHPVAPRPILRTRMRDRALVTLLALSGVRGAEVFSAPRDARRNGLTWADVDFEANSISVLGKSRETEHAPLPSRAARSLRRYREVLEPPIDEWPVFPSRHAASLHQAVRDGLRDEYTEDRIDRVLENRDVDDLLRDHEIVPPSISTNGARNVMKRICTRFDLEIDGEYLKPHGARRGLGHAFYSEGRAEDAQSALRHKSIETTHAAYSNIQAGETADRIDDVLGGDRE